MTESTFSGEYKVEFLKLQIDSSNAYLPVVKHFA